MTFLKKKRKAEDFAKELFNGFLARMDELSNIKKMLNFQEEPEFFAQEMGIFLIFFILDFIPQKIRNEEKQKIAGSNFLISIQTRFLPELTNNKREIDENMQLIRRRCDEYWDALSNKSGAGPLWHLSKKVINNMYGKEMKDPFLVTSFTAIHTMLVEFFAKHIANIEIV